MLRSVLVTTLLAALVCSTSAAQSTQPTTNPFRADFTQSDATAGIAQLRESLIDSFNRGDLPGMLAQLDPDVVVTWQNGEVCRGPEQVKAYYNRMMNGPEAVVKSVRADPKVTDRHVYGDWALSWGEMNDHFTLNDGNELDFNSKFTGTIVKRGSAWKLASLHLSVNAFDNAVLRTAVGRVTNWETWLAVVGAALALVVGFLSGRAIHRRKSA